MMPNAKLGLLVFWPTFWTGFPIKLVIVMLLLAMQVHPWEGSGLYALLVLSVPIDIWALGLCARTVLLERLRVDSPKGTGLRLWVPWVVFSVIYLPVTCVIVRGTKALAARATDGTLHFVATHLFTLPIAERISLELVMIGAPVTIVLLAMLYGWVFGLGFLAQRVVRASTPVDGTFQDIVHQWDLLRIPKDQPLLLTVFTGVAVALIMLFWGVLPVSTPHPHEEYEFVHVSKVEQPIVPHEIIADTERILSRAEATLETVEKDSKKQ
ncbi:MAG: hypothetical protein OXU40_04630 [Nitrospira sp.]|nr:hypothetical protein [Nitrospira sp.]